MFGHYFFRIRERYFVVFFLFIPLSLFSQFGSRAALENKILISLPVDFKLMANVYKATKYPANNQPSEVYTNRDATVNVTFRETNQVLSEQKVLTEGKKIEEQLLSSGKIQLIRSESLRTKMNNIYAFGFYTLAIDTRVYNLMFVFSLKGKMVIGSFNCTVELQPHWQDEAYKIISSIKEL